jgi:hypothetical protein
MGAGLVGRQRRTVDSLENEADGVVGDLPLGRDSNIDQRIHG